MATSITLTPLQALLARATYEEQQARVTEQRKLKAQDTHRVLTGSTTKHEGRTDHSRVVVLLTKQEWTWLAEAASLAASPVPPRIASYLAWRTQ